LIVSIFAVIEPDLSNLCLLPSEGVGEIVVDTKGLAEVTQLFISLAPYKAVPTKLELLIACFVLQVR
jgi:hypothetical protein